MATLKYNSESYTVDHAVKGADFIHGYDADGVCIVAFNGISDFTPYTYSGTYMAPTDCAEEDCNRVIFHSGALRRSDGTTILPASFGAAAKSHSHTAAEVGAAASGHTHTPASIGAAAADHTHTPASIGAAASDHTHTPASIGAASASHTHSASDISAGTFTGSVKANATAVSTCSTAQVRNIYAGMSDMTAGTSTLKTGDIYFVYE